MWHRVRGLIQSLNPSARTLAALAHLVWLSAFRIFTLRACYLYSEKVDKARAALKQQAKIILVTAFAASKQLFPSYVVEHGKNHEIIWTWHLRAEKGKLLDRGSGSAVLGPGKPRGECPSSVIKIKGKRQNKRLSYRISHVRCIPRFILPECPSERHVLGG